MEELNYQNPWRAIPLIPCMGLEEILSFWEILRFKITYKQLRPYQYGVVERTGIELHFHQLKGISKEVNFYRSLIIVDNTEKVYNDFRQLFKEHLGKIPHSGQPIISRMKLSAARFTLTDVSGNCIIFIDNGKRDQQIWEKAEDKKQTPLQQSIATAIRFRDFKEDEKAAAKTLDFALKKVNNEPAQEIAEASLIRMDLAITLNDLERREECRILISQLRLPEEQIARLAQKHDIKADFDF